MGRGKGRGKNIDITKSFFQQAGSLGRVSVQLSPTRVISVGEDEISPTNGSRAALQLWRDDGTEVALKLCQNWRQGTCNSQGACSNAHVLAYHSQMPMPNMVGVMNAFTPIPMPSTGPRDNSEKSVSPKCLHRPQLPHQQPQGAVVDPGRAAEHKVNSNTTNTTSHGTLIPAPRSQQNNRQLYAANNSSAPSGVRATNTTWGREALGPDNHYGSQQQTHNPQPQPQHQPQQQQQQQQQQQLATQPRGAWNVLQPNDDGRRQAAGVVLSAAYLDKLNQRPKDKCELVKQKAANSQNSSSFSGNNSLNRGSAPRHQPSRSPTGPRREDTWASVAALNHSNGASVIWGDGGVQMWDLMLNNTAASPTPSQTSGVNQPALGRDLNTAALRPNSGQLWSSLASNGRQRSVNNNAVPSATINNNNNSSMNSGGFISVNTSPNIGNNNSPQQCSSNNGNGGITGGSRTSSAAASSEALKNQLLRALVGGGAEADELTSPPPPLPRAEVAHSRVSSGIVSINTGAPSVGCTAEGIKSGVLLSLLGNDGDGGVMHGMMPPQPPPLQDGTHKIQHLMALLTTE
ncbi:Zinc finger CCCH domain-containing protein 8 [Trypanosoma brucei equiperdum]|uniref:Zinc finger CCCH domain-containing protein 8 n=1 Tax=Trypanosoma brucei equiperdum TaxID=630700 RepID=A0A3L6LAA0_9TRYP|nr:Zinc finger CCCH domain-containing protein 8 [Trypanosoma brucei equiperdum]